MPHTPSLEVQVVDDEAQVGLASAVVGQRGALLGRGQLLEQLLDELEQVVDLLELAARILVQAPLAGEDVQLFEQLDRLPRFELGGQGGFGIGLLGPFFRWHKAGVGRFLGHGVSGLAPTFRAAQPSWPSFSRVSMLRS